MTSNKMFKQKKPKEVGKNETPKQRQIRRETQDRWSSVSNRKPKKAKVEDDKVVDLSRPQLSYLEKAVEYFAVKLQEELGKMEEDPNWTKNRHGVKALRPILLHVGREPERAAYTMLGGVMRIAMGQDQNVSQASIATSMEGVIQKMIAADLFLDQQVLEIENTVKTEKDKKKAKRMKSRYEAWVKKVEEKGSWGTPQLNSLRRSLELETPEQLTNEQKIQVGSFFFDLIRDHMCGTEVELELDNTQTGEVEVHILADGKPGTFTPVSGEIISGADPDDGFPLFQYDAGREGTCLWMSDDAMAHINFDEACRMAATFTSRPMVIKPVSYRENSRGGWLTTPITPIAASKFSNHSADVLMNMNKDVDDRVLDFLDRISGTAYSINGDVLDAATWVFTELGQMWSKGDNGLKEMKFLTAPVLPEKLKADDADWKSEEAKEYLRERADFLETNSKISGKRLAIRCAIERAAEDRNEAELYFPASLDFRGRVYFRTDFLHPQGDTFCKGVLQFAEGTPIDLDVMRRFIASFVTNSGDLSDEDMSKASKAAQIQWVIDNENTLRAIAADWKKTVDLWTMTDSPFEFLGAVIDYVKALDHGPGYISKVICRIDAVASGIQHLASIARDSSVADAVCLRGEERGTDLYTIVATEVNNKLKSYAEDGENWFKDLDEAEAGKDSTFRKYPAQKYAEIILGLGGQSRGDAKPIGMQYTYGVTEGTTAERLLDDRDWQSKLTPKIAELREKDPNDYEIRKEVRRVGQFMAKIQFMVIQSLSKGLVGVMKWYQQCVKRINDWESVAGTSLEVKLGWSYTNPAGFTFGQWYMGEESKTLATPNASIKILKPTGVVRENKMVTAICANQTHSLDAALLMMTTQRFDRPMSVIHDSIGCLSSDMALLETAVREAHVELYSKDLLADMKAQNEKRLSTDEINFQLPDLPEVGDLEIEEVLTSGYYFC